MLDDKETRLNNTVKENSIKAEENTVKEKEFMKEDRVEDDVQLNKVMEQVFPGYRQFKLESITPSIFGEREKPVISFMVVCNDEAARDFRNEDEVYIEIAPAIEEKDGGFDFLMKFELIYPLYQLQLFMAIEKENREQQRSFVDALSKVDIFVLWMVDKDKNIIKILQTKWDYAISKEILDKLL